MPLDDSKPLTEEVAELRQRMRETGFSHEEIGRIPDRFIEAVILAVRRVDARQEEKEGTRKVQLEETGGREAKIA